MKRKRERHPNTSKIDYYKLGGIVIGLRELGVSYIHISYIVSHQRGMRETFGWRGVRRWYIRHNINLVKEYVKNQFEYPDNIYLKLGCRYIENTRHRNGYRFSGDGRKEECEVSTHFTFHVEVEDCRVVYCIINEEEDER